MINERFSFGEFEFESGTRVLTRKGQVVRLQAQPAQLLSILLARSGQVVSRDELKSAIWGEGTYVDFEKGLNFCVGQIRIALRENASQPVYLRTLPKQGYQFIAPVQRVSAVSDSAEIQRGTEVSRRRWIPLAGGAIALIALILGGVMYLSGSNAGSVPNVAVVRFDAETNLPAAQKLADNLSDDVVVQLTSRSGGRYRVIGNASILRKPRDERDLAAIASTLHCKYVVLGQVQADGDKVLILAHLIRLSDLTHIEVVRMERELDNPMTVGAQAAEEVAEKFARKLADHPERAASFPSAGH